MPNIPWELILKIIEMVISKSKAGGEAAKKQQVVGKRVMDLIDRNEPASAVAYLTGYVMEGDCLEGPQKEELLGLVQTAQANAGRK